MKEFSALEVKVVDNNIEQAIRILKKKIQKDGLFRMLKARRSYEKPSDKRRRKLRESLRRQKLDKKKRSSFRKKAR